MAASFDEERSVRIAVGAGLLGVHWSGQAFLLGSGHGNRRNDRGSQASMSSGFEDAVSMRRHLNYMLAEDQARRSRARPFPRRQALQRRTRDFASTRIAVLATPRSGNTWLRMMLAHVLELDAFAIHYPGDLDWQRLPERAVVSLHWPRTAYLSALLSEADVKVVTITRHPFDVLLSVLRFAQTDPDTREWLWTRGGDEEGIVDVDPANPQFAEWAMSERASALLEVTSSWIAHRHAAIVNYEALVRSPEDEVRRLLARLSLQPIRPIKEAVELFTPETVNRLVGQAHARTAATGSWQETLPTDLVDLLRVRYRHTLRKLGMSATSGSGVDPADAAARWRMSVEADDQLCEEDYRADVHVLDMPSMVASGSRFYCLVKVQNLGGVRWPNRLRHPRIRLGCRWTTTDGSGTVVAEDRHMLSQSIAPGTALYEESSFATPPESGDCRLQIGLVHEHVRWFGCGPTSEVIVR